MSECAIGIDIGGSHVACGVVREDRLLASETIALTHASLTDLLPKLESRVRSLMVKVDVQVSALTGIAVGICAVVDPSGSVAATNGKYDDGIGFNFSRWAHQVFGVRCVAENDTRLALLGEQSAGAARGFKDVVLVTLGTGIGGAVLLGGKLLRSEGGRAGSLAGHLGVDWRGGICSCGNRGCAEAEASTSSLDRVCRGWMGFAGSMLSKHPERIDYRQLFAASDEGDQVALEVLDHSIAVWSALTVSIIHAYDPQVVIFGGGLMHRQEAILPAIRDHVARHAWVGSDRVAILPGALGSNAALLGALPLLRGGA